MARYIDVDKISSYIRENFSIDKTKNSDICFAFIDLMNWLDDQPTADVEEVKHGEWKEVKTGEKLYNYCFKCSKCNRETPPNSFVVSPDYCPNCGAKMDGGIVRV